MKSPSRLLKSYPFFITELSPYLKKKVKPQVQEPKALTTLLATASLKFKEEPADEPDENELLDDNSKLLC